MSDRYEIRVAGAFSRRMVEELAEFTGAVRPTETVISGQIRDQAELHGILDRLQELGLDLVEVKRLSGG
ncbi:MAG: hypothetical protein ITG02_08800 [Patulibacter sp.]|nr:hypothetical protein [Patulibacter sp.]